MGGRKPGSRAASGAKSSRAASREPARGEQARGEQARGEQASGERIPAHDLRLPPGSRDRLPDSLRSRRALLTALLDCLTRSGFSQVGTPAVEYFDVLARGLTAAERDLAVRFIEPSTGELALLRSDPTPQIARMVAQRSGAFAENGVLRLCYEESVIRAASARSEGVEQHQLGAEIIGAAEPYADASMAALVFELLDTIGLHEVRMDLAHAAVARDAIAGLGMPAEQSRKIRGPLARKDPSALHEVLVGAGIGGDQANALLALCDAYGPPSALGKLAQRLRPLGVGPAIERLEQVLVELASIDPRGYARVSIDLGEIRGSDYYTGMRMRVWAPGCAAPVVRGGRYDELHAKFGAPRPATGFAMDLDEVERALLACGAPASAPAEAAIALVAVHRDAGLDLRSAAHKSAALHRARGLRSWVEHFESAAKAAQAASALGADALEWIDADAPTKTGSRGKPRAQRRKTT